MGDSTLGRTADASREYCASPNCFRAGSVETNDQHWRWRQIPGRRHGDGDGASGLRSTFGDHHALVDVDVLGSVDVLVDINTLGIVDAGIDVDSLVDVDGLCVVDVGRYVEILVDRDRLVDIDISIGCRRLLVLMDFPAETGCLQFRLWELMAPPVPIWLMPPASAATGARIRAALIGTKGKNMAILRGSNDSRHPWGRKQPRSTFHNPCRRAAPQRGFLCATSGQPCVRRQCAGAWHGFRCVPGERPSSVPNWSRAVTGQGTRAS